MFIQWDTKAYKSLSNFPLLLSVSSMIHMIALDSVCFEDILITYECEKSTDFSN